MRSWAGSRRLRRLAGCIAAGITLALLPEIAAQAQSTKPPITSDGALVMSGFSGTDAKKSGFFRRETPIDETMINLGRPSLKVFDLADVKGPAEGQLLNSKVRLAVPARKIGQVFGVTLDQAEPPNIYAAASSAFGLQLVQRDADGTVKRLKTGEEPAEWMAGQFGENGGPGTIWRIDGVTGDVSAFADVTTSGKPNSGPGFGNIAFAPTLDVFFVSDLDSGMIHVIDLTGKTIGQFDHGVAGRREAGLDPVADDGRTSDIKAPRFDTEDPDSWGLTQPERRIWGLAFHDGRLYYAVWSGAEIWSVGVAKDGVFSEDARLEITIPPDPRPYPVASLAFDGDGRLYAAQRGEILSRYDYKTFALPRKSRVLRFERDADGKWGAAPIEYPIGFPATHQNASGGVALGPAYDEKGKLDPKGCWGTVWASGDSLRQSASEEERLAKTGKLIVDGAQGLSTTLGRADNLPPFRSYFIDFDRKFEDANAVGHIGVIAVVQNCARGDVVAQAEGGTGAPDEAGTPSSELPAEASPSAPEPRDEAPGDKPLVDQFGNPIASSRSGPVDGAQANGEPAPSPPASATLPLPFDLALSVRSGIGFCSPTYTCPFTLTVTNNGPGPYRGPLVISEEVDRAVADLADWSPRRAWSCERQDTTFSCRRDDVSLAAGESLSVRVDFVPWRIPVERIQNCARLDWQAQSLGARNRLVQETLTALGYQPGPTDGLPGVQTRNAIQAFNRTEGRDKAGSALDSSLLAFIFGEWGQGDQRLAGDRDCATVALHRSARSYQIPPDCKDGSTLLNGRCHSAETLCSGGRLFEAATNRCACPQDKPVFDLSSGACTAYGQNLRRLSTAPAAQIGTTPDAGAQTAPDSVPITPDISPPAKAKPSVTPPEATRAPETPREPPPAVTEVPVDQQPAAPLPRDKPAAAARQPSAAPQKPSAIACPGNQQWDAAARRCDCPAGLPVWDRITQQCIQSAAGRDPSSAPVPDIQVCSGNRVWNSRQATCICPGDLPNWDDGAKRCIG